MKRSYAIVLGLFGCAARGETSSLAEGPRVAPPATAPAGRTPELPALPSIVRPGRPSEPVRIVEPRDGAELDPATASGLAVRVQGPAGNAGSEVSLVLSLDGARPRPVIGKTLGLAELAGGSGPIAPGAHDLVLAAVGSNGVALEPGAGGVASARFFVGTRPAAPAARRYVCLSPFGTYYGRAPAIALDFVLVPLDMQATAPVIASDGHEHARAVGQGPFALGELAPGDHEVIVSSAPGEPPALPGRCVFTYNPELEPSP